MSRKHLTPARLIGTIDILLAVTLAASGSSLVGAADDVHERPTSEWRAGPVRYVISGDEDREFKQLTTDDARARFIEAFWARRDPNPRTLINEYRYEFWERVATANRFLTDSAKPGWKTDMGRFLILLGPPDDRDTSLEMPLGLGPAGVRGAITWTYSHSPHPQIGTGLTIVFTRDASGEFRVEQDPAVVQRIANQGVHFMNPDLAAFGISLLKLAPRLTDLQLMLDLGRLEEVPSEEDLLTTFVTTEEFLGVIPFSGRYDFFAGLRGVTIVAVTISLHPDPIHPNRGEPPDYLIVGRIDDLASLDNRGGTPEAEVGDGPVPPVFLREIDFKPSGRNDDPSYHGPYLYQAVTSLRPGTYRFSFVAFDRATRKTGAHLREVEIPRFSEEHLSLSSLCLSASIEPAGGEVAHEPYVIGNLKVTPRPLPAYRNGEQFAVYYQVYSALTDPETSAANLQIEYQFLVNQGGEFMPIGGPIRFESVGNTAQGWSFPFRDWPTGEFRLQVTVTDSLTGQVASRQVTFTIL